MCDCNMYNFLDFKLKPSVCASCPETDGFEVENLIAENVITRSKGFIAYSAIRPPVNVDFTFICPVNINYILIWTSSGTQKSTGIEFQAKNQNCDFTTICKTYTEAPGIVLYNKKHLIKQCNAPKEFIVQHSRSINYNLLSNTEKIRIRILRTSNSVPCIGRIEIWGNVSRVCSDITKQTIEKLINSRQNKPMIHNTSIAGCSTTNQNEMELLNIPEEFIDPISCEMMSLPMTLPSGKTIDQTTLEKHQQSEAKWGRSPSDPFTGQIFTSLRKPILNTALKSRIDSFLLENANNPSTFNIQRTLGRKAIDSNEKKLDHKETIQQQVNTEKTEKHLNDQHSDVSDSLDDIINKTIKKYKITRFTKLEDETTNVNQKSCSTCETEINLYILKCSHFLCRNCLLKSESHCKKCNAVFSKSSVKRYHN